MSNQNNTQKAQELKTRWQTLNQQREALQKDHDIETDGQRRHNLQTRIDEKQQELDAIESELRQLDNKDELEALSKELYSLKRNKAWPDALDTARQIHDLNPQFPKIHEEITTLEEKVDLRDRATKALGQLMNRMSELGEFYQKIARMIGPHNQQEDQLALLLPPTEQYLGGDIDKDTYIQLCTPLLEPATEEKTSSVDYSKLVEGIMGGDTVLFLGSEVPRLYNHQNSWGEKELAHKLAEAIRYNNFDGNLSSIAELYQLRLDYSQKELLNKINDSLPGNLEEFSLYHSLARTRENLILITSAYDNLLEQAFQQAGKPYVELSSIIHRTDQYDVGHVVINYSDDDEGEITRPQEELSGLNLLDRYSIIYKMRGTCSNLNNPQSARKDALTLSESNYFTIAENAQKMIPDFLAGHLRDRAILFIGFTPRHWEDRLLARILLDKRSTSQHPCVTLEKPEDPLQQAYWKKQNVEYSEIDFNQLDDHLQEAV